MKRRAALKSMLALGAMGLASCNGVRFTVDGDGRLADVELPEAFTEFDHFHITHALRDGRRFDIPSPSLRKDVVIVGGGISGLTALKNLADFDALLVEKESDVGGNSRRKQTGGIRYPLGAILSQGPIAPFTDYFDELAIPFEQVRGEHMRYHVQGRTVVNPLEEGWRDLPFSEAQRASFGRLSDDLVALCHAKDGIFFPRTDNQPGIKHLDRLTFKQYLAEKNYGPAAEQFMKLILSSRLGESGDGVSAWIALYILSTLKQPAFTLPGGHGLISERLRERCLQNRADSIMTGFTVIRIENKPGDKVWVTGVAADGELQTIEASLVVMAAPKVYAKHVVQGLAEDRPGLYNRFGYNAYLMAQVDLDRPVASSFETVSAEHFSRFTVAADWLDSNRSSDANHLTVYVPYPGVTGRMQLYGESAPRLAETIIQDLHGLLPKSRGAIRSIYLHRWGHPMVSCAPGMDQLCEEAKQPFGRVAFAHSDSFGISGLYSAVWSGMEASADARILLEE